MNSPAQQLAVQLANNNQGNTSPNPSVGAVIVKDNEIIGQGATQPSGGKHAEVVAIESCITNPTGADLYVTLEPCCHHGKTGPCTDVIIQSGIRNVLVGYIDPNPIVKGQGIDKLETAGIQVYKWDDDTECSLLYEGFRKHITTNRPFVTAKFAMTLDGKICSRTGDSKWISSPASRKIVHDLRRKSDAILSGIGTVLTDNPSLTARDSKDKPWEDRQPTRIIADSNLRSQLKPDLQIFNQIGNTIIATTTNSNTASFPKSVTLRTYAPNDNGKVDLTLLFKELGEQGFVNVLVEGGSTLLGGLFDHNLVDKVVAFIAPTIIGGSEAKGPVGGIGKDFISDAFQLTGTKVTNVENDILVTGYIS